MLGVTCSQCGVCSPPASPSFGFLERVWGRLFGGLHAILGKPCQSPWKILGMKIHEWNERLHIRMLGFPKLKSFVPLSIQMIKLGCSGVWVRKVGLTGTCVWGQACTLEGDVPSDQRSQPPDLGFEEYPVLSAPGRVNSHYTACWCGLYRILMDSLNKFLSKLFGELMIEIHTFKTFFKDFRSNVFKGFSWTFLPTINDFFVCFLNLPIAQ